MKQNKAINIYGLPFVFENWDEMRYVRERMDPLLEAGFDDLNLCDLRLRRFIFNGAV